MDFKHLISYILIICSLFLIYQSVNCNTKGLSNITGNSLDRIRRQNGIDTNDELDYLLNERLRQNRYCQYYRHGRIYRRPCTDEERDDDRQTGDFLADVPPFTHQSGKTCRTSDGLMGVCESATFCFAQFNNVLDYMSNRCQLPNRAQGICCPKDVRRTSRPDLPIQIPLPYSSSKRYDKIRISLSDIEMAAESAKMYIDEFVRKEQALISRGIVLRKGSTQSQQQAFFGPFNQTQYNLLKGGFINLVTSMKLKEKFQLSNAEARDGLSKYSLDNTNVEIYCLKTPECQPSKYRTADGSCNNLLYPLWAQSNTGFNRLLPPAYHDDIPRRAKSGQNLTNARLVSLMAAPDSNTGDRQFNLMTMQWGQFMDHDLTLTASQRASTGEALVCCQDAAKNEIVRDYHPSCLPITIPREDQFFTGHKKTCLNFVRSAPTPKENCALGYREQMNTLTHVIDASMLYGSDSARQSHLREFKQGRLRSMTMNNEEYMPFDTQNKSVGCAVSRADLPRIQCFVGGDVRVNEQTGLVMLQNLILREHNRIAEELLKLNPNWNDETVFQETRRIVAAQVQHIHYNEWLPLILGRNVMEKFKILPRTHDYATDYDEYMNPNIVNSFAAAAYRFHTLVQGMIELRDNKGMITERLKLRNLFNNPKTFYRKGAFDEYLNGYTTEPMHSFDKSVTKDLTNHLFQEQGTGFGLDLIALNIQRGRDHGLPGYNEFRKVCGLQPIRHFTELNKVMQRHSAPIFERLYKHVDDIDLFIAGNHEKWLPDAVVGPTFACILAEQFRRVKLGDRFWYENGNMPHSFSPDQLREIRKSSMARLICGNTDGIKDMQPLAFIQPIDWNQKVPCSKIAKVNLKHWIGEAIF